MSLTSSLPSLSDLRDLSGAPVWTLDGLRSADPVLGLAVLMTVAVVAAELLHRLMKLPRACGHMLVGALASPLVLQILERSELDAFKPLIDLAIAVLLFELGTRIRPGWLVDNPWLALTCILEGALAGIVVAGALVALNAPLLSAALAGTVAMSTSPVITMTVLHETRPRGQVSERLLLMTAVNSVLAMLALKIWNIAAVGSDHGLLTTAMSALYVVSGSFLLGAICGMLLELLSRRVGGMTATPVLHIGLVIIAGMLAVQWTLSPLLALLVAGMVARARMRHALTVEPRLGSAGAALNVVLFICFGVLLTLDHIGSLWAWVLAIVVGRIVGKGLAVGILARHSGLGWRQAGALTLALQPMSSLAVLLTADTFAWATQLPGVERSMLQAVLIATTLMQLTGPLWTTYALRSVAREADSEPAP